MNDHELLNWLLEGDVSIQYQVYRDLLKIEHPEIQKRISAEGWGAQFLRARQNHGHWGDGFYLPKWISTHYTLLDIKNLGMVADQPDISEVLNRIVRENKARDGGISPVNSLSKSDVCVNGMFLNYASYFGVREDDLKSVIDYLVDIQMPDGGYNCQVVRKGAVHSSLHSTLSVLEGILEYVQKGYHYRVKELKKIEKEAQLFILEHQLFRSHHTGEIIDPKMLLLSFPCRWRYDVLRALEYFYLAGVDYDKRMGDALEVLKNKRRKDGTWPLQHKHSGHVHFDMEKTGGPSRWNTLRALRLLIHFKQIQWNELIL